MEDQVLSIKRMQHLKQLGVDVSKASMVAIYKDDSDNIIEWDAISYECSEFGEAYAPFYRDDDELMRQAYLSLLDAKTGDYDHSYRVYCSIFTLQDMLDIMPKCIETEDYEYELNIYYHETGVSVFYDDGDIEQLSFFSEPTIMESVYKMLCWLAENNYLNNK